MTDTIHLQGIGKVPSVKVSDLAVGDRVMFNYGAIYQVKEIKEAGCRSFWLTMISEKGETYSVRKMGESKMGRAA